LKSVKAIVQAHNPTGDGLHRVTARTPQREDGSSVAVTVMTNDRKVLDAMPLGGEVTITVEKVEAPEKPAVSANPSKEDPGKEPK
jgi:hypothetical protein